MLPLVFLLVSCLAYRSTLIMEAVHSSETSVNFQRITRRSPFVLKSLKEEERERVGGLKQYFFFLSQL
jgi:hypothetical protein